MICPTCEKRMKVVDTRPSDDGTVYRRYRCEGCDRAYRSIEYLDDSEETKQEYLALKKQALIKCRLGR